VPEVALNRRKGRHWRTLGKKGYSSKFLPSFYLKMIKTDIKNLKKGRTEVAYPNVS
jgi:hypothetical protein